MPTGDDHRYARFLRNRSAYRTEQHAREPASAMAAENDELSALGMGEDMADWSFEFHHTVDRDLGIPFLPPS